MAYSFEICANSVQSCLAAREAHATRVELCAAMSEGGCTPSYGMIKLAAEVLKDSNTRLHVIIRPRGGDFCYDEYDLVQMQEDIKIAKELGAHGVVFGCLDIHGNIDKKALEKLIACCGSLSKTFHRAFDVCANPEQALEDIISLGFDRILTSGCMNSAYDGIDMLKTLHDKANGRVIIMAGAGVNKQNIKTIATKTNIKEFHFSAKATTDSPMIFKNKNVSMGGVVTIDEYKLVNSSKEIILDTMHALN